MTQPLISYVVTVFNKEDYLPATVRSLIHQEGDIPSEYIFVDDVSKDRSLEVIEDVTRGMSNVTIVKNTLNAGPSVRINQGVRLARGKYVLCFDSDDVLAVNAGKMMSSLLEEHNADMIYGEWLKTEETGEALLPRRVPENAKHSMSEDCMNFVLDGRFLRMAFMARRETFLTAGGADERIMIQDESIPLRIAVHANRYIKLHAPIMFVPHVEGALSRNTSQLNHDRFLAHRNVLLDYPRLSDDVREKLYQECVSAGWKQIRLGGLSKGIFSWIFWEYLRSKTGMCNVRPGVLARLSAMFAGLPGVRRLA